MEPRVSLITLVVDDVEAEQEFYVDRLGWPAELYVPGEVLMIKVGDRLLLSLWERSHAEAEIGAVLTGTGVPPITLAHNLPTKAEVDQVLQTARAGGADTHDAVERDWGGYSGYFADPAGYRWEVAYNPGEIGRSVLP